MVSRKKEMEYKQLHLFNQGLNSLCELRHKKQQEKIKQQKLKQNENAEK